jgi:hypothetical protein
MEIKKGKCYILPKWKGMITSDSNDIIAVESHHSDHEINNFNIKNSLENNYHKKRKQLELA